MTPAALAILRGVTPDHVIEVGTALYESGFRVVEIPLNSPDAVASIAALAARLPTDCLLGAGTVLSVDDVHRTHEAGGRLIVAPNCDVSVIAAALRLDMRVMPGIATATEAFTAIRAGATTLKLFPASTYGPQHLRAIGAVLPPSIGVWPVGGIGADDVPAWLAAGAAGFGFGSELFRPSYTLTDIGTRARQLLAAVQGASPPEIRP